MTSPAKIKHSSSFCGILKSLTVSALLQVYLVTELLMGGELLDAVLERGSYSEADARVCFAQLLKGIEYLHGRYIPLPLLPTESHKGSWSSASTNLEDGLRFLTRASHSSSNHVVGGSINRIQSLQ